MPGKEFLRMEHIRKVYSNGVVANSDITFAVDHGEIHALSGENGAGKTTLMKMLFGEEQPTRGDIYINGEKTVIASSAAAIRLGIGMVHQHFMLVPSLTVVENMILGMEPKKGLVIDQKLAERQVTEISEKYNLLVPPHAKIQDLTVGQKQKVEILKALFHGAKLLILDEPTAVLTPQETRELFQELKILRDSGYTIIFISHKLNEVRELCDRITIIRRGRTMGVYPVREVSEEEISRLMVGRDVVLHLEKKPAQQGDPAIQVENLTMMNTQGQKKAGRHFLLRQAGRGVRRGRCRGERPDRTGGGTQPQHGIPQRKHPDPGTGYQPYEHPPAACPEGEPHPGGPDDDWDRGSALHHRERHGGQVLRSGVLRPRHSFEEKEHQGIWQAHRGALPCFLQKSG